jgi:hypothetical protein
MHPELDEAISHVIWILRYLEAMRSPTTLALRTSTWQRPVNDWEFSRFKEAVFPTLIRSIRCTWLAQSHSKWAPAVLNLVLREPVLISARCVNRIPRDAVIVKGLEL